MATATSKQQNRASAIVAAATQLATALQALQGIAYQISLDGVTLTGADFSATSLSYVTGAQLDLVVSAVPQIATSVTAPITGSSPPVSIGAAIAAVVGS